MNIFYRLLKKKHLQKEKNNKETFTQTINMKTQSEQPSIYNVIFQECSCLIFENVYVLRAVQLACYGGF